MNRAGVNAFSRYLTPQDDLRIPLGDDVELDCSTSASETPQYSWLKEVIDISGTKIRRWKVVSNEVVDFYQAVLLPPGCE